MNRRFFTILLALLIGLGGIYAHPTLASDCADQAHCAPSHAAGHAANTGHPHCACSLSIPQMADAACRLAILQSSQKPLFNPKSKRTHLSGLALSPLHQDRISIFNRLGAVRRLNKTDSPLSHPVYLQTLALLC